MGKWIEPVNDRCPTCGTTVEECTGIMLGPGSRWEPPDYGCLTVETEPDDDQFVTTILKHTAPDGEVCPVGIENDSNGEHLCIKCYDRLFPEYEGTRGWSP